MSSTYELDEAKNLIVAEELGEYLNEGSISTAATDGSIWITSNNSGSTGAVLDIQSGDSSIEGPTKLSVSRGTLASTDSTTQINESSITLNSSSIEVTSIDVNAEGHNFSYSGPGGIFSLYRAQCSISDSFLRIVSDYFVSIDANGMIEGATGMVLLNKRARLGRYGISISFVHKSVFQVTYRTIGAPESITTSEDFLEIYSDFPGPELFLFTIDANHEEETDGN